MAKQESSILDLTKRYGSGGRKLSAKQTAKRTEEINYRVENLLDTIEDDLQNWENPQRYCTHANCDGSEHAKGYFYQVEKIVCSTLVHDRDENTEKTHHTNGGEGGMNYYHNINVEHMPNGSCPDTDERSVVVVTHVGQVNYSVEQMIEKIQSRVKRSVKEYMKLHEVKFLNEHTYGGWKLHVRAFNASYSTNDVNVAIWIGK